MMIYFVWVGFSSLSCSKKYNNECQTKKTRPKTKRYGGLSRMQIWILRRQIGRNFSNDEQGKKKPTGTDETLTRTV
jgi:hypothetical protein